MTGMLNRNAEPQLCPEIMICEFFMKDFTTSELAATKLRNHVAYAALGMFVFFVALKVDRNLVYTTI